MSRGGGNPCKVFVPVGGRDPMAPALRARRAGADGIEVRLDLTPPAVLDRWARLLDRLRRASRLPLLLTLRSPREGGWGGRRGWGDRQRAAALLALLPRVQGVDVEISSLPALAPVARAALRSGKTLVLSHHDFRGLPALERLDALLAKVGRYPGAILKVAATPRSPAEASALLLWCFRHPKGRIAVVPMGGERVPDRLTAHRFGSMLAYAHAGWATAPGQPSVEAMLRALGRRLPLVPSLRSS